MVGEILKNSEGFILQWWDKYYERWQTTCKRSYEETINCLNEYRRLNEAGGYITKYRIVRETTRQEVIYYDGSNG